jgi:hypothetical protein
MLWNTQMPDRRHFSGEALENLKPMQEGNDSYRHTLKIYGHLSELRNFIRIDLL